MSGRRIAATPVPPEMILPESDFPIAAPEEFPTDFPSEVDGEDFEEEDRAVKEEDRVKVGGASADEVTELTDDERVWFSTLLTCGRRYKTITVMGDHKVSVQTLNADDDLRIGMYTKEFKDSDAYPRAYQIAVCAAGVRNIDGRPLYQSITDSEDEGAVFSEKVDRMRKFYPIVITEVYRAIMDLDAEFAELARKLGKLNG
jgi:hypothetical protein